MLTSYGSVNLLNHGLFIRNCKGKIHQKRPTHTNPYYKTKKPLYEENTEVIKAKKHLRNPFLRQAKKQLTIPTELSVETAGRPSTSIF
jgi:hypothetical protein